MVIITSSNAWCKCSPNTSIATTSLSPCNLCMHLMALTADNGLNGNLVWIFWYWKNCFLVLFEFLMSSVNRWTHMTFYFVILVFRLVIRIWWGSLVLHERKFQFNSIFNYSNQSIKYYKMVRTFLILTNCTSSSMTFECDLMFFCWNENSLSHFELLLPIHRIEPFYFRVFEYDSVPPEVHRHPGVSEQQHLYTLHFLCSKVRLWLPIPI